jgi:hypothetical protein
MRDGASAYLPIGAGVVCAIRARTRAQIQSTQIVRPRPHRTRGGLVEGPRGTGDLSQLELDADHVSLGRRPRPGDRQGRCQ